MTGDLLILTEGMEIPADCLLIEGRELRLDEAAITGESDGIKKQSVDYCLHALNAERQPVGSIASPIIYSGSTVKNSFIHFILSIGPHRRRKSLCAGRGKRFNRRPNSSKPRRSGKFHDPPPRKIRYSSKGYWEIWANLCNHDCFYSDCSV